VLPREQSDADAVLPITIGTGIWLVVLIVLLLARDSLAAHGASWWIGAAAAGFGLGLLGVVFLRWRRRRLHSRQE
jgi:hypothetical protein